MKIIILPRFMLFQILMILGLTAIGCDPEKTSTIPDKLTIGVVSYGEQKFSQDKYERFKDYIAVQTKLIVELEPAYNELQAVAQIKRKNWDIVFAPPGLAAIAIGQELYIPLFPMEELSRRQRSLLIVRDEAPIKKIVDLTNKTVTLGEVGSAAGYYVPLYDLYGLTLAQIRFAPTPKTALQWLSEGSTDAIALSEKDFDTYHQEFSKTKFRTLQTSRWIPSGVVVLGPKVDRNLQEQIQKVMSEAPPDIAWDAGYVPAAPVPNYKELIKLVEKVRPLEERVKQRPAVLVLQESTTKR
jgi:phosphonate transport system substrate-binding protein